MLSHLGLSRVDVFGFSVGGAVATQLAVEHPGLVRKVIISSTSFARDGDRGGNTEAVAEMTVDMIAGTPMEQVYLAKSPHPDREHLQTLLDKLGGHLGVGARMERRPDPRDRRPDADHGRRLRHGQARARGEVPAPAGR